MALTLTISIASVLVILSLVGYLRDLRRSLLALLGTLVGAILVNFWGDQWGASLASRFVDANQQRITFYVSCALFLWSALIVGYGGGILINRAKSWPFSQRIVGALLGLINGALIAGFVLRFAVSKLPGFAATLQTSIVAKTLHDGLPLMFLAVAALVTFSIAVRAVLGLFRRTPPAAPKPVPATKPAAPASPPAASAAPAAGPEKRLSEQDILKKVADAAKR